MDSVMPSSEVPTVSNKFADFILRTVNSWRTLIAMLELRMYEYITGLQNSMYITVQSEYVPVHCSARVQLSLTLCIYD